MGKRLVAYFSASGVTKGLAEKLAEAIETDIFEIAPVEPYTEADLKWTNPLARCNREKAGKKDVAINDGNMPVILYLEDTKQKLAAPRHLYTSGHPLFFEELERLVGAENIATK